MSHGSPQNRNRCKTTHHMTAGSYIDILKNRGFLCFFCTQFLGAFNDNFYKIIITLMALDIPDAAGGGKHYIPLIGGLFILPFLLFSGYAGYLADVYSKKNVLVAVKCFEILAMSLGFLAFFSSRMEPMLAVVFLMGLHSTIFSPAKYGILPEMLPEEDLSRGNGLLEMSTFMAIILGTSLGGIIYEAWKERLGWIGIVLVGIAVLGTLTSLGITRVPPSGAAKKFVANPIAEISHGARALYHDRTLWLTVMGISYFWFLGAFLQMGLPLYGKEILALGETRISLLWTFTALGVGAGSLMAGRLSGAKIELGLVPLGAIGMGLFSMLLYYAAPSFTWAGISLVLIGFFAGFFAVPLNALLQQRAQREAKGRIIATNNVFNTLGVLGAAALLWLFVTPLQLSADLNIVVLSIFTFAMTFYVLRLLPDASMRFVLWLLTHTFYRIRVVGRGNIPLRGPALLVSNHVSFVDAILIGASMPRFIRFMLHREYYDNRWLHGFFRLMKAIPVMTTSPRGIIESLRRARQEVDAGQVVCIFAEGAISRTGHLLPFRRGFEKIVEGSNVPIVPVHLDRIWGSIFSFKGGRFFWKRPRLLPYPVTVSFGTPLPSSATVQEVRQAVQELESEAARYRRRPGDLLHAKFIRMAKRRWFSFCMADTTGAELTCGKTLIGARLLANWMQRHAPGETMVGVLLPASVGGALANIAVSLAGKVPVNLNFTSGADAMRLAIEQCGIKTILTSRLFLTKAGVEELPGMIHLEELRKTFTPVQKLAAFLTSFLLPAGLLEWRHTRNQKPADLATVIFSSGSTGIPKGVMLSHHNIISNIEGIQQVIQFEPKDRMMGVLPLFHSFGFTGTLWLPLLAGFGAVYHPNPTDAKTIGETVKKFQATLLISTPTFYAGYLRRCSAEEFSSLHYVIAGAEKLRESIAKDFKKKYGIEILEGYGCTELAPVVSVNIPDVVHDNERQTGNKPGTVGHPIPGVAVKVIDPDSGKPLPYGTAGMLLAKGGNLMLGYLGQPELTAEVIRDGWYITGDIASLDEDGFIRITDRLSRFSKIGGEMVPHVKIEEVINEVLGGTGCAVTAVADPQRGEKLVAFYTANGISPQELWDKLNRSDLPKLWIPKRENLHPLESIPILGSGKADLKKVKELALERSGEPA
jgi:acyl-[acyl-carrier-protein]-phospholipid O-acyltransferase/long-chain-fatty-acid--[acyl-carrier-protein] ligase